MPSPTFLNLSSQKRDQFITVSLQEFARYDFFRASITQIVNTLGIAKGSVYQYFADKKDLYRYLIELSVLARNNHLQPVADSGSKNFFKWLEAYWVSRIKFALEFPLHNGLLRQVWRESDLDVQDHALKYKNDCLDTFLKHLKGRKKLRKDANNHLLAYFTLTMENGLLDYLIMKHRINYDHYILENMPVDGVKDKDVQAVVQELIKLMRESWSK